jgi:molecular chaperone GrpE (heat shock protein)
MTSSPKELATQNTKIQRDQERLIHDLLGILDDLDRACEHWQQAETDQAERMIAPSNQNTNSEDSANSNVSNSLLKQFQSWLKRLINPAITEESFALAINPLIAHGESEAIEVVESAYEGVEMIRRSLLDILRKQNVIPMEVMGKPFDPSHMYAIGRQESTDAEENTVVQEIVRGYLWQNRILRESQVMVAMKPSVTKASE